MELLKTINENFFNNLNDNEKMELCTAILEKLNYEFQCKKNRLIRTLEINNIDDEIPNNDVRDSILFCLNSANNELKELDDKIKRYELILQFLETKKIVADDIPF